MTMRRVLTQACVRDDDQFRRRAAYPTNRALHDAIFRVRTRREFVFRFRQTKQDDAAHAAVVRGRRLLRYFVNRQIEYAGHRRDLAPYTLTRTNKERQHEVVRREPRLAYERAQRGIAAESTRTMNHFTSLPTMIRGMSRLNSDERAAAGSADFLVRDQFTFDRGASFS